MTSRPGLVRSLGRSILRRLLRRQVEINASFHARLERLEAIAGGPREPDLTRLEARLGALETRQSAVEDRTDSTLALGWDHVALVRTLARIEDRLDSLERHATAGWSDDGSRAA